MEVIVETYCRQLSDLARRTVRRNWALSFLKFYKGRGVTRGVLHASVGGPGCAFQAEGLSTV